jgi:23S rRNA pseudouridine2605 synthase
VLAAAGVASRRAAEELIAAGRVQVDGAVVRVMGTRVDPARARIEVDGERVDVDRSREYLVLNKPSGVVTTARDPVGRPTVVQLVRARGRVYPVGRLDADTTGLLLLTSHGELAHRLTHPRYRIPRTYLADVRGTPSREALDRLRAGVGLEDGIARASAVRVRRRAGGRSQVEITVTEGRKHEVRRMLEAVGHPVSALARIAFGPLSLGDLKVGKSRRLSPAEIGRLLAATGL